MINSSKFIVGALLSVVIPMISSVSAASLTTDETIKQIKAHAIAVGTYETFMPENNLHLRKNVKNSEIDRNTFDTIIDSIVDIYAPIVSSHGATLRARKLWNNNRVNAVAFQSGSSWYIEMYGGLARAPETTPDGFAMVVCHELGHHIGGFPFYGPRDWAASEGQSDYFATHSCARQLWSNEDNSGYAADVHPAAKTQCDAEWNFQYDRELCYRTTLAGQSLGNLLAALQGTTVSYNDRDNNVVSSTRPSHPRAQCRLDTYLMGSLCNVEFDPNFIPGKDAEGNRTSLFAEKEAALSSCTIVSAQLGVPGSNDAYRPRCWYKPRLNSNNIP